MTTLTLSGVSCGSCEARITRAVQALDAAASLRFSTDRRQVEIASRAGEAELIAAIRAQGYEAATADNSHV